MQPKTNKHRPAKRVKPPTTRVAPPAKRTASTRINFFNNAGNHYWEAWRGGRIVAESFTSFSSRDKAVRSLKSLALSFAQGDWKIGDVAVK